MLFSDYINYPCLEIRTCDLHRVERSDYHCATHPSILIDAATPICLAYSFRGLMASWENKVCIIYSAAFTYITHSIFFLRHRLVFSVTGYLLWLLVNFPGKTEVSQTLYNNGSNYKCHTIGRVLWASQLIPTLHFGICCKISILHSFLLHNILRYLYNISY